MPLAGAEFDACRSPVKAALWEQLPETSQTARVVCPWCLRAAELQEEAEPLGGEDEGLSLSQSSQPPQSVFLLWDSLWMVPLSFTTEHRGPSPGRDLLRRYFIYHPVPSCWLNSVKRHCGINPWRSDSVTLVRDGFADLRHKQAQDHIFDFVPWCPQLKMEF